MDLRRLLPQLMQMAKAELPGGVKPRCIVFTPIEFQTFDLDFASEDAAVRSIERAKAYCTTNNGIAIVIMYESYYVERSSYVVDSADLIGTGIFRPEHIHILGSTPIGTLLLEQHFYRSETGISYPQEAKGFPNVESPLLENLWQFKEA